MKLRDMGQLWLQRKVGMSDLMSDERIEIILHDNCLIEIETHGYKGVSCDEILEILKKNMPDEDFSNVKWTREYHEPSSTRLVNKTKKQQRRG